VCVDAHQLSTDQTNMLPTDMFAPNGLHAPNQPHELVMWFEFTEFTDPNSKVAGMIQSKHSLWPYKASSLKVAVILSNLLL